MRCRLAILTLIAALPGINVLAAPAPDPWAILDIGPPEKGETVEEHRNREIEVFTCHGVIVREVWQDPELRKLPSAAALKDPISWLEKNLRVTPEGKGNRLRLKFRAGNCIEQVAILNSILRIYIHHQAERIKFREGELRIMAEGEPRLAKSIKETQNPDSLQRYLQQWENGKIAEVDARAEIARLKQVAVIKWAK
ncbi:MAG TPA: hypothetical protein VH682_15660 [Gemmataceae bacterium]|jgi:hypothetical protein